VQDSGIGVPDEEKSQVFQRFYRVAKSRSLPGNGLGLSLVNAVADIHQARIELTDTNPGEETPGLTITVRMPAMMKERRKRRRQTIDAASPANPSIDSNNPKI
jgi:signal transduction histidine kinase